jgi:predicted metal-dependent hydrolase
MPAHPAVDTSCAAEPHGGGDGATVRSAMLVEALRQWRKTSEVPPELAAAQDSLERRIRAHLARGSVTVTLTDNRYTMISVRRVRVRNGNGRNGNGRNGSGRSANVARRFEVRLHHMFAYADPVITRALAHYIADNDNAASRVLGDFIDQNAGHVRGRARRAPTQVIFTAGEHHDLRDIYDEINARYFDNKIDAAITWGARTGRPRRRNSIKMGSYSVEDRLIRIHRSLDRAFVPRMFVAWIVFHEMLHQVHDIRVKNGRREFHSKEFLADEALFEQYEEAKRWERHHLDALLTY